MPFGRYAFNKLPFGILCVPELFQRRMSRIFEGLEGVIDDILVHGTISPSQSIPKHQRRTNSTNSLGTLWLNKGCQGVSGHIILWSRCRVASEEMKQMETSFLSFASTYSHRRKLRADRESREKPFSSLCYSLNKWFWTISVWSRSTWAWQRPSSNHDTISDWNSSEAPWETGLRRRMWCDSIIVNTYHVALLIIV